MSFCDILLGIEDCPDPGRVQIHIAVEVQDDILMPLVKLANDEFF